MENTNLTIGLLLGDPTGIGPEITMKALQSTDLLQQAAWVLIGDKRVLRQAEEQTGRTLSYKQLDTLDGESCEQGKIYFIDLKNIDPSTLQQGQVSAAAGKSIGETLEYSIDLAVNKKLDGIVYAPLNKGALHAGGYHFQDEIHFFASLLGSEGKFGEINRLDDLFVTRLTSHVPISKVSSLVKKQKVEEIIRFAHQVVSETGAEPKIAVAGLNPHAGDGGLMGMEEIDEIRPAIEQMKQEGINVEGPFPADTIYLKMQEENYNGFVSMYHDQAQIGMKLLGFHRGVTISGGLPVVLTTPAHGTAFDIVGQNKANPEAMKQAIKTALEMAKNRKSNSHPV